MLNFSGMLLQRVLRQPRKTIKRVLTRRIAVVGNGPVDPRHAAAIDGHDLVIRLNACANYGASGCRTDVLVLTNSGEPSEGFARDDCAINAEALASAKSFWLARSPQLVAIERTRRPEDVACWVTCDEEIIRKRFGRKPWLYIAAETYWLAKQMLDRYGAADSDQPSTGIIALFHLQQSFQSRLRPCRVTLYGFTHQGWHRHPWAAESALVDSWQDWAERAACPAGASIAPLSGDRIKVNAGAGNAAAGREGGMVDHHEQ